MDFLMAFLIGQMRASTRRLFLARPPYFSNFLTYHSPSYSLLKRMIGRGYVPVHFWSNPIKVFGFDRVYGLSPSHMEDCKFELQHSFFCSPGLCVCAGFWTAGANPSFFALLPGTKSKEQTILLHSTSARSAKCKKKNLSCCKKTVCCKVGACHAGLQVFLNLNATKGVFKCYS